jgi:hypothetical protein
VALVFFALYSRGLNQFIRNVLDPFLVRSNDGRYSNHATSRQPALTPELIAPGRLGEVYLDSCFDNDGIKRRRKKRQVYSVTRERKNQSLTICIYRSV